MADPDDLLVGRGEGHGEGRRGRGCEGRGALDRGAAAVSRNEGEAVGARRDPDPLAATPGVEEDLGRVLVLPEGR